MRGVGLGLFVAEGIIRGVGGRMAAGNRTDGVSGAVFSVTVPAAQRTEELEHA